ncbi:MAG: hypothetical protein KUG82_11420 [Pseudomonadales bacterium]|nr:hypothetical protein [Pseudomonadales bacterium]
MITSATANVRGLDKLKRMNFLVSWDEFGAMVWLSMRFILFCFVWSTRSDIHCFHQL